jgi:hypothetical protein
VANTNPKYAPIAALVLYLLACVALASAVPVLVTLAAGNTALNSNSARQRVFVLAVGRYIGTCGSQHVVFSFSEGIYMGIYLAKPLNA